jgi:hypothetical protein
MNLKRNQSGQAMVLTVLFITALMGMAAMVLDAGSWFRAHRELQATADAAALAGAQALPDNTGDASSLASQYADKNTSGLTGKNISFETQTVDHDTIVVHVSKPAPGFFSKVFGIDSVQEGATAKARTGGMQAAKYVAPIVVRNTHPMLAGTGCPCFGPGNETTIPVGGTGAPGAFALLNLLGQGNGTAGASDVADWMESGFDKYLPIGGYYSDPGVKFNSDNVQDALNMRLGTEMLFPVYDSLSGQGSNAVYHIIGWVGFHLDGIDKSGNNGSITGYFTQVIWDGIQAATGGGGGPNFGARTVQLVD